MKKNLFLLSVLAIFLGAHVEASTSSEVSKLTLNSLVAEAESNDHLVAQKWTAETDLTGLGLSYMNSSYTYTVLCEDGITTLGLYYSSYIYVTGINTTASEVVIPDSVSIDGVVKQISYFGRSGYNMDWSGAPNLTKLNLAKVTRVYSNFSSTITDLYVGNNCNIYNTYPEYANIYIHIPYGSYRNNYSSYGFKRVFVGDEQPDYPETTISHWVIAGEEEGDYFGISQNSNSYCISEIFTAKDSIALPTTTPTGNGTQEITRLGGNNYSSSYGDICKNATNLKWISVPATYNYISINWASNPITSLYMQGNVPTTTNWNIASNMKIYTTQAYYINYYNNSSWNSAYILPYGWDLEWMTVNVERKGEFAQTYIEMTDADWSKGIYVKITGELNETDLNNINNLTNLIKLDLSEAEFTTLPSSFLSNRTSLKEVILPATLTSIASSAFYYCTRLEKVTASGITSINGSAFEGCSKLTDLDISNVTAIGSEAFYNCNNFNPATLSAELNSLGSYAFYNSGITEVSIPEKVTIINSYAFSSCKQLQKVTLPGTITQINGSAFRGCSMLSDINLPNSITTINYYAFENCTSLTEMILPESVTTIGSYAFNNCSNITNIVLPSTLQSIGNDVFDNCTSLATVKCKAIVPPTTNGNFTYNVDLNHCTLYIAPFAIDAYRAAENWNSFYIMKPLNEPVKNIYINRPMVFDLLSEDNAVLQENPNMTLDYSSRTAAGQLSASGDGTLSAGVFSIYHKFYNRNNSYYDTRTTLINNAENMRADSVLCSIEFEKNVWHFISFQYDVKMEDIFGLNNTDFVIRTYNSTNRASGDGTTSNWENVPANGTLEAGKGYIIQVANNSRDENGNTNTAIVRFPSRNTTTKNNLFTPDNVAVTLEEYPAEFAHNRSWNLVGNPYPCYYDMNYLMEDFTTPIVLWRGSSYQAYSPVDDDIILRPNEAFFVQRPLEVGEMVFGADGRMHFTAAYNSSVTPGSKAAPYPAENTKCNRSVFNFNIEGCGSDDRARIVMNEGAAMDYEINCDASKFFAEVSEGAEIYVDGTIKYDICERPFADGTAVLGTRIAKDGSYTISLNGRAIDGWNVILKDTETGATVDLTENAYRFDAKAGTSKSRFALTFNAPGHTSVEETIATGNEGDVRVANAAGITVFEGNIDTFKANAEAGVYIVIDSNKTYKIVIK